MNTQLLLTDLVRQSVYSRLAGYEDVNDAERLSQDPAFRLIGSRKIWERGGALTSRLQSFETEVLTPEENLAGLAAIADRFSCRWPTVTRHLAALVRSNIVAVRPVGRSRIYRLNRRRLFTGINRWTRWFAGAGSFCRK